MRAEKILVVYFSQSGHTKKLAKEISRNLKCDIEEIKTTSSYGGFLGYQRALLQSILKLKPKIKSIRHNLENYDLVIIGGPVWAGSISSPVRSFLSHNKKKLNDVAFFLTRGGPFEKSNLFDQMEQALGKNSLATLSVSDKELDNGKFKKNITTFMSELGDKNPKIQYNNIKKETDRNKTSRLHQQQIL